jgi:hypothetical protein
VVVKNIFPSLAKAFAISRQVSPDPAKRARFQAKKKGGSATPAVYLKIFD